MEIKTDERIVRLEGIVEGIAQNQQQQQEDIRSLGKDIRGLADVIAKKGQTHWGVLASWASVIIGSVSVIGWLGVGVPVQTLSENMSTIHSVVLEHKSDGHPHTVIQKISDQEKYLLAKNEVLKKETVIASLKSQIKDEVLNTSVNSLKNELMILRDDLKERTQDKLKKSEYQFEIERLERQLNELSNK